MEGNYCVRWLTCLKTQACGKNHFLNVQYFNPPNFSLKLYLTAAQKHFMKQQVCWHVCCINDFEFVMNPKVWTQKMTARESLRLTKWILNRKCSARSLRFWQHFWLPGAGLANWWNRCWTKLWPPAREQSKSSKLTLITIPISASGLKYSPFPPCCISSTGLCAPGLLAPPVKKPFFPECS